MAIRITTMVKLLALATKLENLSYYAMLVKRKRKYQRPGTPSVKTDGRYVQVGHEKLNLGPLHLTPPGKAVPAIFPLLIPI